MSCSYTSSGSGLGQLSLGWHQECTHRLKCSAVSAYLCCTPGMLQHLRTLCTLSPVARSCMESLGSICPSVQKTSTIFTCSSRLVSSSTDHKWHGKDSRLLQRVPRCSTTSLLKRMPIRVVQASYSAAGKHVFEALEHTGMYHLLQHAACRMPCYHVS